MLSYSMLLALVWIFGILLILLLLAIAKIKDNIGVWDVLYLIGNFTYRVVVAFTFFFVFGMATKFHWTTSVITVFLIWFVAYSFAYEAMKIKSHKELGNSVYVLEEKEVLR